MHILTVGWSHQLKDNLWDRVNAKGEFRVSQLLHPSYTADNWPKVPCERDLHFFCEHANEEMPEPDRELLASLERQNVPTIHNMIRGDRVVSKLPYVDALRFATFLARRLIELFNKVEPTVVIGGFDALHSGLSLAVAKRMNIPWFALHFSVLPMGLASFCDQMIPSSIIHLDTDEPSDARLLAEKSLQQFENRRTAAFAYIAPATKGLFARIWDIPGWVKASQRTLRKSRQRDFLKYVEYRSGHSIVAATSALWRSARARKALSQIETISTPPAPAYIFFGLHFQPESSIDVWAPFFSDQMWVINLLSRSIPPTHKLLVKIHKSDVSNYSKSELRRMMSFPGVEIVSPTADTHEFIKKAELVIAIQGTIGLEAALLGKPVITLGDSLVGRYPSASPVGKIQELPALIRNKLAEAAPSRGEIVEAYAAHLAPFLPAGHNNWRRIPDEEEIDNYVGLFRSLQCHLAKQP